MLGGRRFRCYDWGALGWLLDSGRVDTSKYKFFVFLNSSIRGPFLPAFWPVYLWPDGMHAFWPAFRFHRGLLPCHHQSGNNGIAR